MPIFEFDELSDRRIVNGKEVLNYWGYNTVSFFAPNTSYASAVEYNREGLELKELIKALHENGIEVILDVVFNHTAEGNEDGPFISFKGFDNNIYYLLTPEGYYYNFSGCGNTMNCNHPVVQRMIIDCLRYWVTTYRWMDSGLIWPRSWGETKMARLWKIRRFCRRWQGILSWRTPS